MATGKYDTYAASCIESARAYFCKDHDVTYFVFTDGNIPEAKDVVTIYQKKMGWPYDTLKRFHVYNSQKKLLKEIDYLFSMDSDMRFF